MHDTFTLAAVRNPDIAHRKPAFNFSRHDLEIHLEKTDCSRNDSRYVALHHSHHASSGYALGPGSGGQLLLDPVKHG